MGGRKIAPENIRRKQYDKKKEFYRLFSKEEMTKWSRADVIRELDRINEFKAEYVNVETSILRDRFTTFNTSRHLLFWHDGSCGSNHSH